MLVGRFLIGTAVGCYCFNIPVYIAEMASKEIRGLVLIFFQVFVELGILFVYTTGFFATFPTLNFICAGALTIFTLGFMFLPEAPCFLIRKNKIEEASKAIKLLRGSKYDAQSEIEGVRKILLVESSTEKSSFMEEIRKPETYKAFIIILSVFFFFQTSGINAVTFYATAIFVDAGIDMTPALATIIIALVQVFSTLTTSGVIDRFGRVFLLIVSFTMMIIGLSGVACFFFIKDNRGLGDFTWLPLTALCVFVVGFSVGIGPVPFVLLGELFSDNAKRVIAPLAQTLNFFMLFANGLLYPKLVGNIGNGPTFIMFAGFCVVGLLFTIFVIPETKGKSLAEIQTLLKK